MRWRARTIVQLHGAQRASRPQLKRDPLGRRPELETAIVITKSIVLETSQPLAALLETLRRAAAYGETRRVPDQLRTEDVDALYFALRPHRGFRIIPEGLRNALVSPRMTVEGRGRVLSNAVESQVRIQFEVGLDMPSVLTVGVTLTFVFGAALYNLLSDPSSLSSFTILTGFGCLMAALVYFYGRALVNRAWPGLLVEARRLADGSLYVPAA